jgi:hypothetical protein
MYFVPLSLRSSAAWRLAHASAIRLPLIGDIFRRRKLLSRNRNLFGKLPSLDPPITFNEHILHRILYDRDPRLKIICDKIAVRDFISSSVGSKYVVPLLGVWTNPEEINWASLPEEFVLKPNHSSGRFEIVSLAANYEYIIAEAKEWLGDDYFDLSLEWGYRGISRRLLAEPLLVSSFGGPPREAQIYTFSSKVAMISLVHGRKHTPERSCVWYDVMGRRLAIKGDLPAANADVMLPEQDRLELIEIAERISQGFSFLRVDFYLTDSGLRIGELTPYSGGGQGKWYPSELDEKLGRLWDPNRELSILDSLLIE